MVVTYINLSLSLCVCIYIKVDIRFGRRDCNSNICHPLLSKVGSPLHCVDTTFSGNDMKIGVKFDLGVGC